MPYEQILILNSGDHFGRLSFLGKAKLSDVELVVAEVFDGNTAVSENEQLKEGESGNTGGGRTVFCVQ